MISQRLTARIVKRAHILCNKQFFLYAQLMTLQHDVRLSVRPSHLQIAATDFREVRLVRRFSPIQSVITPNLEKMICHKQQIHDGIKLCNHTNLGQFLFHIVYYCVFPYTLTQIINKLCILFVGKHP